MRILFSIKSLALKGGAERSLIALSAELARRGHDVDIAVRDDRPDTPLAYAIPDGVHIVRPPKIKARPLRLTGSHQASFNAYVAAKKYDVIVGWLPKGGAMVGWLPRRTSATRIVAMRNLPYNLEPPYRHPKRLRNFWKRRIGYGRADYIFVQMRQFVPLMPKSWQRKAVVIPNAAPVPSAPPVAHAGKERLVIAISRIVEQKRLDALVRGFAMFRRQFPEWRLEIWGEGEGNSRTALQGVIDEQCVSGEARLMGVTDDIEAVYARARILAHPSRKEGMANAVAEAMAHGLAVVGCADCHGMEELIVEGRTGLLVPGAKGSKPLPEQLCAALSSLASDPQGSERMGSEAARHIAGNFSPKAVYDRWEQALLAAARGQAMPR